MADITDQKELRWQRSVALAKDIIDESRVQLMLKFRFLDLALWRMGLEDVRMQMRYPMATDGKKVFFNPERVLMRFQESSDESIRDYLHMVMHCIFRHPFDKDHKNAEAWWLTCDIIVESAVMGMCGGRFESPDDERRKTLISELMLLNGSLMPGKIYMFLDKVIKSPGTHLGFDRSRITEMQALFERDNHEAWPSFVSMDSQREENPDRQSDPDALQQLDKDMEDELRDAQQLRTDTEPGEEELENENALIDLDQEEVMAPNMDEGDAESGDDEGEDSSSDVDDTDNPDSGENNNDSDEDDREREQEEKDWEEIAKQIEMNLETFSKEWGDEASALIATLRAANRKMYDYTEFLRRFMTQNEVMKINDDEYDYVFYTYGLELYGDMPLVEPLEYKETQRIRDFVIVVDTSESVRGDLVKKFINHTFEILKESEYFGQQVNIHIIQCDAKVQSDTRITDLRDVDAMMEEFYLRGFGGTDFRPAFDYVDQLRKYGDIEDLKGLIYFTDGMGQFPDHTPDYDAAFVFMDTGERFGPSVPPWAMKIVIDEEGINRLKSRMR